MAIITEDYVSFEVAKLLREKRFNEPCNTYWFHMINAKPIFNDNMPRQVYNNKSDTIEIIGCPTLQMAMKWLREVHKIYIDISPTYSEVEKTIHFIWQIFDSNYDFAGDCEIFYDKYEQACEAAIKYCLENLI